MLKKALILTTAIAYVVGVPAMAATAPVAAKSTISSVSNHAAADHSKAIDVKKKKKKKAAAPPAAG